MESDWWDSKVVFLEVESKSPSPSLPDTPDPKCGVIAVPLGPIDYNYTTDKAGLMIGAVSDDREDA